uniref:Phosphatidylinositol-specific phospholipase C X domain-containing protein n=1 Tax=viral metagenome TaxID=1070528 RepID=A0A6C0ICP1_9ZZZZ
MTVIRKWIIFLVILISFFILYHLLLQRAEIMKLPSTTQDAVGSDTGTIQEGMATASTVAGQTNELSIMTVKNEGPGVTTYNVQSMGNLPLKEYCIKSSYNSACSGTFMNLNTIKYILQRGCRFLDFELYYINQNVVVGFSDDGYTMLSKNTLALTDVFASLISNGFSAPSPNLGDPLFVQLRIRTTDPQAYQNIATAITSGLSTRLFKGNVNGNTLINTIMGKIVLVVDAQVSGDYSMYPICNTGDNNCKSLGMLVNMQSNIYPLYKYNSKQMTNLLSNPPAMYDSQNTDITVLRMIEPATSTETVNPNSSLFIQNYGVQIVENRFYMTDTALNKYEQFFRDNKMAFVPFYIALPYLHKSKGKPKNNRRPSQYNQRRPSQYHRNTMY